MAAGGASLRNIAQVIAAAVATFNDSEPFRYEGMNSLQVSRGTTSLLMPCDSLPRTIKPESGNGMLCIFSPP